MKAIVSVGVHPTEDRGKVVEAVERLFPGAALGGGELLSGEVNDLSRFRELVEQRRIRNALESILNKNYCAGSTYIMLNKQAAFMGKPNAYAGQELGPIKLELECEEREIHEAIWGNKNE
jgi:predicted RNA binding protein with dsRBD fold (UPF0201 family)